MSQMTPEQALQNLDKAAASINGNREAHAVLRLSVQVLAQFLLAADASTKVSEKKAEVEAPATAAE